MEKHCDKKPGDAKKACNCTTKDTCGAENAKKGDLIRYYLKGVNTPLLYNDIQVIPPLKPKITESKKTIERGPSASTFNVTGVEEWYVSILVHGSLVQWYSRSNAQ